MGKLKGHQGTGNKSMFVVSTDVYRMFDLTRCLSIGET